MKFEKSSRRSGRRAVAAVADSFWPYTMKMPDGRTIYIEVPNRWISADRDGRPAILPEGVEFLDRVRALAMKLERAPSPGFIIALREALGHTQKAFGAFLNVDKMTVSRWERGVLRPSPESLAAIEGLRRKAVRRGVTIPSGQ